MTAAPLASTVAGVAIDGAGLVVVIFFLMIHTATALLLVAALPILWRQWDPSEEEALEEALTSAALPTVSIVVTGRAPRDLLVERVRSLLGLRYPRHEVVLVHDGEASGQLPALLSAFDLYEVPPAVLVNVPTGAVRGYYRSRSLGKLFVIDKEHAGHADDLNAALNASRFPYILTLDVGITLLPDALLRLMQPFLLGERVAAVAAGVRVDRGGGARRWVTGARMLEALRDSTLVRLGWNRLGGQLPARGDVLLHRRDHLLDIDGFRTSAADPELDVAVRLRGHLRAQQLPHDLPAIPDAVAWAPARASARSVAWRHALVQRGRIEELLRRRAPEMTAAYDLPRLARLTLALTVLAPLMEAVGYLLLIIAVARAGIADPFVSLFLVAVPGYAMLLSVWAVAIERVTGRQLASWRDVGWMCASALAEQLGYRQWVMWHRLRATGRTLLGRRRSEPERAASLALADESPTADGAHAR